MKLNNKVVRNYILRLFAVLPLAIVSTVLTSAQTSPPVVVSSLGYINGTPLTAHTSTAFNSTSASTLVAFVSTNTPWNGQPVSISGLSDNLGNTWNLLTGPALFSGNSFTLLSAIYYVNAPATSLTHSLTVQLTNPAPLVFHVFAVSGSDIGGPPIFSAITDPGAGGTSANVTTAPISVPTNSLLLSWVKNETGATATALNGYTLDTQSTSFLWAESQSPISAGSYTGDFQYDSAIGWQTAIVGLKPRSTAPPKPVITSTPANPTNQTGAIFSFTDSQTGVTFVCQLDGSVFSACSSPQTYSGLNEGSHTFSVKAQDAQGNQSAAASFTWTVDTTPVVNHAPVALNDSYVTREGVVLNVPAKGVLSNDADPDSDPITAVLVSNPANGTLALASDGSCSYTPKANFHGVDTFTYQASDGKLLSNVSTVTITVEPVNHPPLTEAGPDQMQNAISATGAAVTLNGSGSSDIDGDMLTYTWKEGGATIATGVSPTVTTSIGRHTITLEVNDGHGGATSDTTTVTITDFSLTATPASVTIRAGQQATFLITASPVFGSYTGSVVLACPPMAQGATCTFTPSNSVSPGANGTSTTLTISTVGRATAGLWRSSANPAGGSYTRFVGFWLLLPAIGMVGCASSAGRWSRRPFKPWMLFTLLIAVVVLSGCGGGGTAITPDFSTPPGAYSINISGTASSLQRTISISVVVQ